MKKFMLTLVAVLLSVITVGQAQSAAAPITALIHRPAAHMLRHGASTNWSGYAAETSLQSPQSNAVSSVSGQWVVPTLDCSRTTSAYSSVWVGIDGYSDNTVEQTGTEQDCSRRHPVYYAWYEMYPNYSYRVNLTVAAGDAMMASVQYTSGNSYTLTLTDRTTGKSFSTVQLLSGTSRQSAEWVVEAPSSFFGVLPLANFGTASMTNAGATINGQTGSISNSTWQNDKITMVTNGGAPKATPSVLSATGDSFSVTWNHQ